MKRFTSVLVSALMLFGISGAFTVQADPADAPAFTADDVRNLQDYLTTVPADLSLKDKPYDFSGDKCWTAADLTLMKRGLLPEAPQNDTIVVYFSRTGNTEKIAEYLIELTGAGSYEIEAAVPYSDADIAYGNSGCRANQEQNDKTVRPEIAEPIASLDGYDTVFLGYPIWWGEEPRIIDTFLESYDFSEKTVIPFCTSASSGISVSEKNIAELVPIGNQLTGRRFAASASKDSVKSWYDSLPLETEQKLILTVNGQELTAELADSTAAKELAEKLKAEPISVMLNEYGGFEKVGKLPWSLTKSDESIVTGAGDIMLYQGNQMTVFYDSNTWSYTRLGHIGNVTQEALKNILGDGNVTVELSVK